MSILVESLKRLYENKKISLEQVMKLFANKKINQEEYNYIVKND